MTTEELQRYQIEKAKKIVADLKRHRRKGEAEIVFVFGTGELGQMSYVATADREDCMTALFEWLGRQDREKTMKAIGRYLNQQRFGSEVSN